MKPASARNIAASVRKRLLNIPAGTGEDFNLLLIRYALERLLYRLSQSEFRDHMEGRCRCKSSIRVVSGRFWLRWSPVVG